MLLLDGEELPLTLWMKDRIEHRTEDFAAAFEGVAGERARHRSSVEVGWRGKD